MIELNIELQTTYEAKQEVVPDVPDRLDDHQYLHIQKAYKHGNLRICSSNCWVIDIINST